MYVFIEVHVQLLAILRQKRKFILVNRLGLPMRACFSKRHFIEKSSRNFSINSQNP